MTAAGGVSAASAEVAAAVVVVDIGAYSVVV